jgi:hypothetical protein
MGRRRVEAGQLRRWTSGSMEGSEPFLVLEEQVNRFGSGPGDSWNGFTYLMSGVMRSNAAFTIIHHSEVIDG